LSGEVTVELNFEISSAGAPIANISGGELLPPVNTRNLDTFIIEAVNAAGQVIARSEPSLGSQEGSPVPLGPEVVALRVDTGRRIQGAPNSRPGGGR